MEEKKDALDELVVSLPLVPSKSRQGVITSIAPPVTPVVDSEIIAEGTSGLKAEEEVKIVLDTANRLRQGVITGGTPASTKLKKKMLVKKIQEVKVPEHIRKVSITINDKKPNDPISVVFAGDWDGSDLNLAGKHLILEYNLFVRNRAIRK